MYNPGKSDAWKRLCQLAKITHNDQIADYFIDDKSRFEKMSLKAAGIFLDYSKNKLSDEVLLTLFELLEDCHLSQKIVDMYSGEIINETEDRAVLHTALRNRSNSPVFVDGEDVMPQVNNALHHMEQFVESIHSGTWLGLTGKRIHNIVNIGIGGSDLGPHMVCKSLGRYRQDNINVQFVSNVDSTHIQNVLRDLNYEETLFIISSKSFTTQETMLNAMSAKKWFLSHSAACESDIHQHFVAVSTNVEAVTEFGIDSSNIFEFWDWVGGRYSLWSSIGLPIALSVGYANFIALLEGAHEMDVHFKTAPAAQNLPILLALVGIWNINFQGAETQAIIPYAQALTKLPAFLQQLDMESNGKGIDKQGERIDYATGPIVWGQPGTNGQHAFFQLLHQGQNCVPVDFIASLKQNPATPEHNEVLLINMLAQAEAFMIGNKSATRDSYCAGNKPSNVLLLDDLSPKNLGALIAAYEHKVFVQGVIWNINSFDQWGVQLGKKLVANMMNNPSSNHDGSTSGLLAIVRKQFK